MSTIVMLDTLDTPMLDFTDDTDVAMGGSSNENWHTGMHIDEDGHHDHTTSQTVLEVDMATYEETTEYEMLDESVHHEPVDAEVVDVSFHESPQPSVMVSAPSTNDAHSAATHAQSSWTESIEDIRPQELNTMAVSESAAETHPSLPERTTITDPTPFSESVSSTTPFPPQAIQQSSHDLGSAPTRIASQQPSESHNNTPATEEPPVTEHIENVSSAVPQSDEAHRDKVAAVDASNETLDALKEPQSEVPAHAPTLVHDSSGTDHSATNGESVSNVPETESYVDPPPPIHLSLRIGTVEGDQPDFVIFNPPESSSSTADEPLVLLQHLPSLYYEPISAVFEAFRSEEYFSHLQELSEAEMAINAYDLQLVISEDNVYAREVSLHDLFAMHHGVGLPGHLRLSLQSVVPRFITRYNQLRDQITSLTFADAQLVGESTSHASSFSKIDKDSGLPQDDPKGESAVEQTSHASQSKDETTLSGTLTNEAVDAAKTAAVDGHDDAHGADKENEADDDNAPVAELLGPSAEELAHSANETSEQIEAAQKADDVQTDSLQDLEEGLDADNIHDASEVREGVDDEQDTEYFDAVAPEADDEEGYVDENANDGVEGTGVTNDEDPTSVTLHDEASLADGDVVEENTFDEEIVHAQSLSASSSHATNEDDVDANADADADADADAEYDHELYEEEQTDHSRHEDTDALAQGNYHEEDDIGDEEFGEEDVDNDVESSEDGTLDGSSPTDDGTELTPNTSLPGDQSTSSVTVKLSDSTNPDVEELTEYDEQELHVKDFAFAHKNGSKRSLDDAELEEEVSPLDSPGSKRSRVL
ncbi:hypothetical protein SCHPADRAFT_906912 [Schizopora paradoxa]|uniref:Uncharacterized protein n=1 Tax=Schizopora paradoxa TaxID=27342 RepID=A0A0H2REZ6_9AGAM|nr:hypothetical protein SCHPADRAFT_906912 [Schizopora paradoxa]